MMTATRASMSEQRIEQGAALLGRGDCSGALDLFQQVMQCDPGNVLAIYNAGVACHGMGQYPRAARLANEPALHRRILDRVKANRHKIYDDRVFMTALEQFYRKVATCPAAGVK